MLLSFPNWIIHLSSSLEWGVAAALFFRYGKLTRRRDLRMFGLAMLPHWAGSFFVLAYHVSGDTIPFLLDMSELINLFGSTALLLATLNLLKSTKPSPAVGYTAALAAMPTNEDPLVLRLDQGAVEGRIDAVNSGSNRKGKTFSV